MLLFNDIIVNIQPFDLKNNRVSPFTKSKNSTKIDKH